MKPQLISDLNYQDLLEKKISRMTASYQKHEPDFKRPTIVDPIYHALSEVTFTDLMIRNKINYAALQFLSKYSDQLDELLPEKRMAGESMEDFRERISLSIKAPSSAGSIIMYEALALNVGRKLLSAKVIDTKAIAEGDTVVIYIQTEPSDRADQLKAVKHVEEYLNREGVKPALDLVQVRLADAVKIDLQADFTLDSQTPISILDEIKKSIRKTWQKRSKLSWNPSTSWMISQLQVPGVYSVSLKSPSKNIALKAYQYPVLANISFELGRSE